MDYYKCIKDFTIAFDCFYRERFNVEDITNNRDIAKLRYDLIKEELTELNDAIDDNNFIEVIDALTDIIYVTYGAAVTFGIDLDSEIVKLLNHSGDISSHFEMVNKNKQLNIDRNILENKEVTSDLSFRTNMCTLILEAIRNCLLENEEIHQLPVYLTRINIEIFHICVLLNINLDTSFDIVHKSNMSKLCQSEQIAIDTVQNYKDNDDRYDTPFYMKSKLADNLFIVKNKSTGKVLKSINYIPANFENMLN